MSSAHETYFQLLDRQKFMVEDVDYSVLERHKVGLQQLAEISNSTISVFDSYKRAHVFYSSNFGNMLGYSLKELDEGGEYFLDTKVHPDDFTALWQNAITFLKVYFNLPDAEKRDYKLVSEYRILNSADNYVRVIEQQMVLELDINGNLWLGLSILDISPNQKNMNEGIKSEVLNFKTGRIFPLVKTEEDTANALTKREIEILKLVKNGFLSKEISGKLNISVNTVNTHRQRVLEKLDVDNSMEAVMLASKLGLV